MTTPNIFNIIDPGMMNQFGHHRDINICLGQEMLTRGHHVRIFANAKYEPSHLDPRHKNFEIIPHFSTSPYYILKNELSATDILLKHTIAEQKFHSELAALQLHGSIHFSNLFSYQLKAIARTQGNHRVSGTVHVHPNRFTVHGEFLWTKTTLEVNHHLKNIDIFSTEEPLVNEIDRITNYGNGARLIPFPLNCPDLPPHRSKTNRIGILGSLRQGQGFGKINATIDLIRSCGFNVLLQDSKEMIQLPETSEITKIGYLKKLSDAFTECDAVLLNYEPETYRFMGSGILWEALAHGVPFLYTRGTALAYLARKYKVGIDFSFYDTQSLKQALQIYRNDSRHHDEAAIRASHEVRQHHSAANYLNRLFS